MRLSNECEIQVNEVRDGFEITLIHHHTGIMAESLNIKYEVALKKAEDLLETELNVRRSRLW